MSSAHSHALVILTRMLLTGILALLCACTSHEAEVPDAANAVYYWRQDVKLNAAEQAWLEQHDVRKVYLHLFDVVRQDGQLQPRATIAVTDRFPAGVEVIPVVFLAYDIMRDTTGVAALPRLLARRVQAIMEQNHLGEWRELQIDFDWTRSNQTRYFGLLKQLQQALDHEVGPKRMSATIRLHQLQMKAPPVDYGALMVYNVGKLQSYDEACSILSPEAIEPYLRNLPSYGLPLCVALPVYSWNLLFHDQEFHCILRGMDVQDTCNFLPYDKAANSLLPPGQPTTHYMARRYMPIPPNGVAMRGDGRIIPGDVVRHEFVTPQVLHDVCQTLRNKRASACQQIILYHLDEEQLNQYTDEEIDKIYSGR